MGSLIECTRILGLEGYRVKEVVFDGTQDQAHLGIRIEREVGGIAASNGAVDSGVFGMPRIVFGMTCPGRDIG